jgi:4-hydroxy-tetrahydrodipicolinate synthase
MFSGSITALVTPFRDGKVDEASLAGLVEFQITNGISGIVPCGTTGESPTLTPEEHVFLVRRVVELVRKRVYVIAGTGSNSTREAIHFTQEAERAGADGALLISPYYNRPTQEGIYQHYKKVAGEVGLPLIVYNIPSRTGSRVEPETLARLSEIKNIVGVKEATGSLDQVLDILALCGDRLAVLSGEDSLALPILAVGGCGVISTVSNITPREVASLVQEGLRGNWEEARRLQYRLLPLIRALFFETNPIPVKAALALMGKCGPEIRLPLTPVSPAARVRVEEAMRAFGLL